MKIDLHLHTEYSQQNGDNIKWLDIKKVLKILISHGIKIASFTDHNTFKAEFYSQAKQLADTGGLLLLPGIEVNVVRTNGIIAHMLIIFSNELSHEQLLEIEEISKTIFKNGISIKTINNLFDKFKTIRIIHIGKSECFGIEDLQHLSYDAIEITNYNHPNYLKFIKNNLNSSIVAFSDTHIWDNYPQINQLVTNIDDLDQANFDGLKKCLSQNKNYTIYMR